MTKQPFSFVEDCTQDELSIDGIRKRAVAFNETFAKNGGYKGYEAQAIDVLLAEIERLELTLRDIHDHPDAARVKAAGALRLSPEPEAKPWKVRLTFTDGNTLDFENCDRLREWLDTPIALGSAERTIEPPVTLQTIPCVVDGCPNDAREGLVGCGQHSGAEPADGLGPRHAQNGIYANRGNIPAPAELSGDWQCGCCQRSNPSGVKTCGTCGVDRVYLRTT